MMGYSLFFFLFPLLSLLFVFPTFSDFVAPFRETLGMTDNPLLSALLAQTARHMLNEEQQGSVACCIQ